jgi:hypothetical protein
LSFQSVYDYKKRLRELTRLSSIVRQIDIINFVNDFWKNLDSNLAKKKIDKNQYIEELCLDLNIEFDLANQNLETELMLGLYKNFADELIMVKKNKQSKKKYYIHPQYEKLESA